MRFIPLSDPAFVTYGRVNTTPHGTSLWVFPYTQIRFRCTGTTLAIRLHNRWNYGNIRLGVIIDDTALSVRIPTPAEPDLGNISVATDGTMTIPIADHLPNIEHEIVVFKRQDGGMHVLEPLEIGIDDNAIITRAATPPQRRIEFYGDSVTAGERNEAVAYTGCVDPEEDLSAYSNSWYSYAAMTARILNADTRLIAQGGIPLLDGIGWFNAPHYTGMESVWDRTGYGPAYPSDQPTEWDFTQWVPQVVVVALGQNDSHPDDFMAHDPNSEQSQHWRQRYGEFLMALREQYPQAHIVCATTILEHDMAWDSAIRQVVEQMHDPRITHFLYARNGCGTPGHPRIAEDREMAQQLSAYLSTLMNDEWQ